MVYSGKGTQKHAIFCLNGQDIWRLHISALTYFPVDWANGKVVSALALLEHIGEETLENGFNFFLYWINVNISYLVLSQRQIIDSTCAKLFQKNSKITNKPCHSTSKSYNFEKSIRKPIYKDQKCTKHQKNFHGSNKKKLLCICLVYAEIIKTQIYGRNRQNKESIFSRILLSSLPRI